MAKFRYNNVKNASASYTLFEFNCDSCFQVFCEKNINLYSQSNIINRLEELCKLISLCCENFYHA